MLTATVSAVWPVALALVVPPAVIVWLHLRRRPGRLVVVPSLSPWLELAAARSRRRRSVPPAALLLLHLAAALLLALGLAAWRLPRGGGQGAGSVIALDATTSMAAEDRWPRAQEVVQSLAGRYSGPLTLVVLGPHPWAAAVHTDAASVGGSMRSLKPAGTGIDWDRARRLVEAAGGKSADIHVVTDGSGPRPAVWPARAAWHVVGTSVDNVAVTEAEARAVPGGTRVFATVANLGSRPVSVTVRLTVDGSERDRRTVQLDPSATYDAVWPLQSGGVWAEVRADAGDALPADDWAPVALTASPFTAQAIGLSDVIARAVEAIDGLVLVEAGQANYRMDGSVDVTIAQGTVLDPLPPGGVVAFAPAGGGGIPTGRGDDEGSVSAVMDHPLGHGLDLLGAWLAGLPMDSSPPVWSQPVLEAGGRVAAYAGTLRGSRVAVFAFDATASEVSERVAFPVLVARAVAWAARSPRPTAAVSGHLQSLGNLPATVSGPEGHDRRPRLGDLTAGWPGRYETRLGLIASDTPWRLGVRAGDPSESDLTVRETAGAEEPGAGRRVFGWAGQWLAAMALAVLALEAAWRVRGGVGDRAGGGRGRGGS